MRSPIGEGRDRLLRSLFEEFGDSGPGANLSMRQIADRLSVHHTLMTYHFGSRPQLLLAVLAEARRRDNVILSANNDEIGFVNLCTAVWNFYSNPMNVDRVRAFFHVVGLTIYDINTFAEATSDINDLARILEAAALRENVAPTRALELSIVASSGLRGLLLQKLLTPSADIDAAARSFISGLAPTSS